MESAVRWVHVCFLYSCFSFLLMFLDSDVIHFSAMGISTVVLSSVTAAKELLDRRSAIYSGRYGRASVLSSYL